MKNIYKSEIFGEMMSLSDEDLASIDCKSMVIMQEVKRGRAIQEPRLIMTSTDGKQTIVDGYDNVEKTCKNWLRIIEDKRVPLYVRICNLIETYLAGIKASYIGAEQYSIRRVDDGTGVRLAIPEKNIYAFFDAGMSEGEIARQLIGTIRDEFTIQHGSSKKKFYFNGVFWTTKKKDNGPLEIMTADEIMVMMENSTAGHWLPDGKFESRQDIRTWTSDESYSEVMASRKMVETLVDPGTKTNFYYDTKSDTFYVPKIKITSESNQNSTVMGGLEFKDLSDEIYRTYEFPDGKIVKIYKPLKLNVSKSGGHRVLDEKGISHYIPAGWIHLQWKVKDGKSPFAF